MLFSIDGMISVCRLRVSPFTLLRQVLSRVLLLTKLTLILVAPFCLQKGWFVDLLAFLVEEPL